MNVCLSVCVMGLIMASYALHNEPPPTQRSYLYRRFDKQHVLRQKPLALQLSAAVNSGVTAKDKTYLGKYFCRCFSHLSAPSFADA